MVTALLVAMALLVAGFLGTRVAAFLRLPHSVFLVVLGMAAGELMRIHGTDYARSFAAHFPDVILYVLLPPLIFEASFLLDARQLKRDVVPISALAVVAMVTSTLLIGYALHLALGLELLPSLTFGALISATDPVAVVALFKEVGAPKRLSHLVEAESLLNDGTAMVLFRVLLAMVALPVVSAGILGPAVLEFGRVALGGVVVGAVVAAVSRLLLRFTAGSGAAQIGMTVAAAYVSFLAADVYLGVSGVIATMTVGVVLGRTARLELNKTAAGAVHQLWEFLALSANILVFFAVGLSIDPALLVSGIKYLPLTILIVYVARGLSVFTTIPLVNQLRLAERIPFAYQAVLVWGGLRGGLALALVLTLPVHFPHRDIFLVVTAAVVLSTLFVNALTTKPILRLLKLDRMDDHETAFYQRALALIHQDVFAPLMAVAEDGGLSKGVVEGQQLAAGPPAPVAATEAAAAADFRFGLSLLLLGERRYYEERLQDDVLSRSAYLIAGQSVTERLDVLQRHGAEALTVYEFPEFHERRWERRLRPLIRWMRPNLLLEQLTHRLEALLNRKFALAEVGARATNEDVKALARRWTDETHRQLDLFYRAYPHYGGAAQAFFIATTVRAQSERMIGALFDAGVVTQTVAAKARTQISGAYHRANDEAWELLRPSHAYLLARVAPFRGFPRVGVRKVADLARRRVVAAGKVVVYQGQRTGTFYLVIAGMLEVDPSRESAAGVAPTRLFTGDAFGEGALLLDQPYPNTVVAVVTSEILELDRRALQVLADEFPTLLQAQVSRLQGYAQRP